MAEAILLTVIETTKLLNIGKSTLQKLAHEGKLKPAKIGKKTVYSKAAVEEFAARLFKAA